MSSSPPAPGMEDMEVEAETAHGEAPRPLPAAETGTGVVDGSAAANHTETSPSTHDHEEGGVDYSSDAGGTQSAEVEAAVHALWREVVNLEEKPSAGNTCSVCMEAWTCQGLHRICCIPCGHVYGRSCLEKWLHENAKCPQCKLHFEEKLIINLYTPANFGDGCGTIQEVKVYVSKAMAEVAAHYERQLDSEIARFEAAGAQYARQFESEFAMFKAEQRLFHQAAHEQLASTARILDEMDQMQAQIEALQADLLVKEQPSCQAVAASSEASRVVEGRGTGSAEPGEEDHQSQ